MCGHFELFPELIRQSLVFLHIFLKRAISRQRFTIYGYDDYERVLHLMGYTSDNSNVNDISSRQDSDISGESGSSGVKDSGKFCSYRCDFSENSCKRGNN